MRWPVTETLAWAKEEIWVDDEEVAEDHRKVTWFPKVPSHTEREKPALADTNSEFLEILDFFFLDFIYQTSVVVNDRK